MFFKCDLIIISNQETKKITLCFKKNAHHNVFGFLITYNFCPLVGQSVGLSVGRSKALIVSVGPSVRRFIAQRLLYYSIE